MVALGNAVPPGKPGPDRVTVCRFLAPPPLLDAAAQTAVAVASRGTALSSPSYPSMRADPLTSPVKATAYFGGVFLLAFLVNAVKFILGLRPGPDDPPADPTGATMILGWLGFAVCSGCSVAFARRRIRHAQKNLATGLIVGFFYSAACLVVFGHTLRWGVGAAVLVVGVWGAVAWAISSGLSEIEAS
jgi:hypothetical protein